MSSKLLKFLRHNSRHSLYKHPTYKVIGGTRLPFGWHLNPIGSVYDGKQKKWDEPLWVFRLRQKWFANAGENVCQGHPSRWSWGPDGNRTCDWCGSIHVIDLMKICRLIRDDERYSLSWSDKGYKCYITQPDVVNASQGAIKFYTWHGFTVSDADKDELLREALRISRERWQAQWDARHK